MPIDVGTDYPTSVVDLATVKNTLGIDDDDTTQDSILTLYIGAATDYVNFVSGQILPQVFTEQHSGGKPRIILYNSPVIAVASVVEYVGPTAYPLTQMEIGTGTSTYTFSLDDPAQGILTRRWNGIVGNFLGQSGDLNVQIVYTAGYAVIPDDITQAVITDIQGLYNQSQQGGRPDVNGGDSTGAWTVAPINAFPRLASILTSSRRVQAIA